jgi:tetratricopeptide (TPR) repeat protein
MTQFYDQAVALVNRSRYDLAERQLRQALVEDPAHAAAYSLLGICLARLKKPKEAMAAANEGLRLAPGLAFAHYARACVRVHARQRRKAIKDVEEAIRIDPTRPNQFFLLAAINSDLRQPKHCLAQAERGLKLDPTHTGCASLRALSLQRLGRKREAEVAITQALMLDPNNDFTHTAQGWRLLQKNDRRSARQHFLEAMRLNAENRWAQTGLAAARARTILLRITVVILAFVMARVLSFLSTAKRPDAIVLLVGIAAVAVPIALAAGLLALRDRLRDRAPGKQDDGVTLG